MNIYWRLVRYLFPYKWRYFNGILCSFGFAIFNALIPVLIQKVGGESFKSSQYSNTWFFLLGAIILTFLCRGLCDYGQAYFMNWVGQRITMDMRNQLYQHMQSLGLDFFVRSKTGELISRITHDVYVVQGALTNVISDLFKQPMTMLFLIGWLIHIDPLLTLLALVVFPVCLFPIIKLGKKLRKASQSSQEKMADMVSILQETISGIRIVKAFGMENHEVEKFKAENKKLFKHYMDVVKSSELLRPITEFLGAVGFALAIWYGTTRLAPQTFASFVTGLFLIYEPSKKLSKVNTLIQIAISAGKRIFNMLDVQPKMSVTANSVTKNRFEDRIIFENVWFKYEAREIIKNISFEIHKGEVIALVGSSGSGKTTLTHLLMRFYDPYQGRILIDGVDIKDLAFTSLRSLMGIVTQDTTLFHDSVKDNIAYGHQEADLPVVQRLAQVAFADEFIQKLPQVYDTVLGEKGTRLSEGQKQRIAIARALYKNSPILVLDEATSALDSESERMVQEALYRLMKNRTVLVIAHRLSTIQHADRILVLQEGQIVETGRHEELIEKKGVYYRLYQLQFATLENK